MTTTITTRALATELDVDLDTIETLAGQIAGIDGQDATGHDTPDGYVLTAAAADAIREQVASYDPDDQPCECLDDLCENVHARYAAGVALANARSDRDVLIRAARKHGHTVASIMSAAETSRQTVYEALES